MKAINLFFAACFLPSLVWAEVYVFETPVVFSIAGLKGQLVACFEDRGENYSYQRYGKLRSELQFDPAFTQSSFGEKLVGEYRPDSRPLGEHSRENQYFMSSYLTNPSLASHWKYLRLWLSCRGPEQFSNCHLGVNLSGLSSSTGGSPAHTVNIISLAESFDVRTESACPID